MWLTGKQTSFEDDKLLYHSPDSLDSFSLVEGVAQHPNKCCNDAPGFFS